MPVPQGLPSLSPMGEEFPLFWSLDMMRLGSSVFFLFFWACQIWCSHLRPCELEFQNFNQSSTGSSSQP